MMSQVVILAGGKGTRLKARLGNLPKPLIDICGIPLLERQVLLVKKYGFTDVVILVNHQAHKIEEFCKSRNNWGLDVRCVDDGEPCGTAGAVLQSLDYLDDEFLVMYGDTMLEVDLKRFYDFHNNQKNVAATLFLHPNDHPQDSDLVEIDEYGQIIGFHPYPHQPGYYFPNLVNAALYWVRKSSLLSWKNEQGMLDFGKDLFPKMLKSGLLLRGYNSPEYIKDCGTPSRLDRVCGHLEEGSITRSGLEYRQKAVFIDRGGTLNVEVGHLNKESQLELLPGVEKAVRTLNQTEYRTCVVTNQPVIARGDCNQVELKQIHNKLETLLGYEGAYLDRIYYCPHHPDSGFEGEVAELKISCDCRKPSDGMIRQAVLELNIDVEQSWMVGDSTADIMAATNAGIRSVLVQTGHAGFDEKYNVTPDFVVDDFVAAVDLICNLYPLWSKQLDKLLTNVKSGEIIFVGGQSKAGKSTAASVMRDVLKSKGLSCNIISTDRWLKSEAERGEGVESRHDLDSLVSLVKSISSNARPGEILMPFYMKKARLQISSIDTLKLSADDVIIIEGVVALELAKSLGVGRSYFIDVDEEVRRQRFYREYLLRGEEAEEIYHSRLEDEIPWVDSSAIGAQRLALSQNIISRKINK